MEGRATDRYLGVSEELEPAAPSGVLEAPAPSEVRTFLIADVRGYSTFTQERGDEAAARLAAKFAEVARGTVGEMGGEVIELRGDEALAVFQSARQALRTAVDLQCRFSEEASKDSTLPLEVGIGLDAGEAIPVEGGYRGGALNLAARLCSLAGRGEVLSSEAVLHLARKMDGLDYGERGLVQLKGFADPVRVMQVRAAPDAVGDEDRGVQRETESGKTEGRTEALPIGGFLGALPESLLVARDAELERVLRSVDAVVQGTGRLVLLSGEPGVGKTRLAQEVTLAARNRGFLLATGRCYESHETMPFYPFVEALTAAFRTAPASVRFKVEDRWPVMGRLLPNQGIEPPPALADGHEEQQKLFWAVTGFLQELAAEVPIALLLDDLHWADSSSLELLEHLARQTRGNRIFLFGTYRDVDVGRQHPLERALLDLGRERLVEDIGIRRLQEAGTAALVAATMGAETVSDEFAQLLYERTEGNAYFVEEVLRALVERGDVYRENGNWERREIEEIEVPKSVRAVIGQRLSRLSEASQEVLYEASVLGQTFEFEDLRAVSDRPEQEVESALEEAGRAGLVREAGRDAYAFNHALTQQGLYSELTLRRKRRLHLSAGEALERLPDREHKRRTAELARHFLEADEPDRALRYSVEAGHQAAELFAHGEAKKHYRTALEFADELDAQKTKAEVLEKLGKTLRFEADYEEAIQLLEQAAALYREQDDISGESRALSEAGIVHRARGTPEEGIAVLEELAERIGDDGRPEDLAPLYGAIELCYFTLGRYADGLKLADRSAELARRANDELLLARAEVARGTALGMLGRSSESVSVLESVIPLARKALEADPMILGRALVNLGNSYANRGEIVRARDVFEEVVRVADGKGDRWGVAFALSNVGSENVVLGEWTLAQEQLERALEISRAAGTTSWGIYPLLEMANLLVRKGDEEEAARCVDEALSRTEADVQALRYGNETLARVAIDSGQAEKAVERLNPLLDREGIKELGVTRMLPLVAEALLESGDKAGAERTIDGGMERANKQEMLVAVMEFHVVRGMLKSREGLWEISEKEFGVALSMARKMPHPYEVGRIQYQSGLMLAQRGDLESAQERFSEALEIFERLGAKGDVPRVRAAMGIRQ